MYKRGHVRKDRLGKVEFQKLYSTRGLAKLLGISYMQIQRAAQSGKLPSQYIGNTRAILGADYLNYRGFDVKVDNKGNVEMGGFSITLRQGETEDDVIEKLGTKGVE